MGRITLGQSRLVFLGRDHGLIGFNSSLTVHLERVRIGVRGQRGGINGKRLIGVAQVQILLQIAAVYRMAGRAIGTVVFQFDVPPPLFDIVQAAVPDRIIQARQHRGGFGNVHRSPTKGGLRKQPLKVPRAGFHTAPAHRPAKRANPVGRAALAVGFPDLVSVEHQLRARRDRTTGTFTSAFVAAFAKGLQPEINRLVVGHRQVCCNCT